jgi:hypothetical protein
MARGWLGTGGILMVLLGLARGAGGLALLVRGPAADPRIRAGSLAVLVAGVLLVLLGVSLVVAGVGTVRRRRAFRAAGIVLTVLFVVDGLVNGVMLYGRPGIGGTLANVVVALVILACLGAGKGALRDRSV